MNFNDDKKDKKDEFEDDIYDVKEEKLETVFHDPKPEDDEDDEVAPQNEEGYEVISNIIEEETDHIKPQNISTEMRSSFLEYAMSVIVSRALPDAKDGLKPVHRRILFGMSELGISHSSQHKKSARIVGEVLGKYHPHGDSSVYEAMVRMSQDFSMRYPLVDGHGNFGSIDGDGAAAMRYTEARMSRIAATMVDGLKKETVDFVPNYDGSELEPSVLPARIPNLLITGGTGIAVGMATNIPPHNLKEVIDGVILYAKNNHVTVEELNEVITGPDFPTSGIIMGTIGIKEAYETGRGSVVVRSRTRIEELKNGKKRIIITEIPYMVNKAKMIEKIAILSRDKVVNGVREIRDESSRQGIRVVIDVKRDSVPEVLLNKLFKLTPLQSNFSVNMIALVNGQPEILNLRRAIEVYFNHQIEVITRRTKFDLDKATAKAHVLEGLKIATQNIDMVIKTIRESSTDIEAQTKLSTSFNLSSVQSKAITDMRLGRLTGLAIEKMQSELNTLHAEIKELTSIYENYDKKVSTLISELNEIKSKFGDDRRTEIIKGHFGNISDEDLIPESEIVISISSKGYVKRISLDEYKIQHRGGVGMKTVSTYDDDDVSQILVANTHSDLLIFTSKGKVYKVRSHQIPKASRHAKGTPFLNIVSIEKDEKVITLLCVRDYNEKDFLLTTSKYGVIKKTKISEYERINRNGKIALGLRNNDELLSAIIVSDEDEIIIGSSVGKVVRFKASDIRSLSRTASGVKGMSFANSKSHVIGVSSTKDGDKILSIGADGFGKMTSIEDYRITKRGAKGVKTINTEKAGKLAGVRVVDGSEELIVLTTKGITIRTSLDQVSKTSRATKGVKLVRLEGRAKIASIALIKSHEIEEEINDAIQRTQEIDLTNITQELDIDSLGNTDLDE